MAGIASTDRCFETTFADLAFARLRDKAPSMLDYLVGFQLLDKDDDETRAVGLFGFKVGSEWIYAPVFFINGQLKGHELMYLKSQDAFVPMSEQWVNYILNRKPNVLGENETTPRNELGLRQPDFDLFARAPYIGSKAASLKGYVKQAMCMFEVSPRDVKFASLDTRFTIPGAMKALGKQAAVNFLSTMANDQTFSRALLEFYDMQDLLKVAAEVIKGQKPENKLDEAGQKRRSGKDTTPTPKVITNVGDPDSTGTLSNKEKEFLLKEKFVVRDARAGNKKSRVYQINGPMQMNSPIRNGFYDVMLQTGESKRMLLFLNYIPLGYSELTHRAPVTVLIDPDSKKWGGYANSDILSNKLYGKDEFAKFIKGLPNGDTLKPRDVALLVTPDGAATEPFRVESRVDLPNGMTELKIWGFHDPVSPGSSLAQNNQRKTYDTPTTAYRPQRVTTVCFTNKSSEYTQMGATLFVPNTFKAVELQPKSKDGEFMNDGPKDLALANMNQMLYNMEKKSVFENKGVLLKVGKDRNDKYVLTLNDKTQKTMDKIAAIKQMVEGFGMDGDEAISILSNVTPFTHSSLIIKEAWGEPPMSPTFQEPAFSHEFGINAPVQYPMETIQNLTQNDSAGARDQYKDYRYIDERARQQAGNASQLGQKEVLDTAVISGLVRTMDSDSAVDDYISDMLLGLDRVGRILFMYYWHNDKFQDRYGKQDMIELENNLRNVFKSLGELTLFLKQKTVSPDQHTDSESRLTEVF